MNVLAGVQRGAQRRAGELLRARVAGEDAADRAAVIWGREGERWFGPEDPIWRVHADAAMFPGGVAALLLQTLHPLAMAGVSDHSGYRGDLWGRLQRTSHYLAATTFGTEDVAQDAIARVRRIHGHVRGTSGNGTAYSADDPHLLRWVHVAEVRGFLRAYQAYAREPLTAEEADTYVAQTGRSARLLGATDLPESVAQLEAQVEEYRPELHATRAARQAARMLLLNPPLPVAARPAYSLIVAGGVAVLPRWARSQLRLPTLPGARAVERTMGRSATRTIAWAMAGVREREVAGG